MSLTNPSLEELSGYLGVGSLQLLGIFFVVDGLTNLFPLVDAYAKSNAVAILFTVPLLVIAYVLGLLCSLAVEIALQRFIRPVLDAGVFAAVVILDREPLLARYAEVERHSRLLHGCALAFLLLAVGSLVERRNMEGFDAVGTTCAAIGIVLAMLCLPLARHLQRRLLADIAAVRSQP